MCNETGSPVLQLSPTAWAKLVCLRDLGESEVGFFGVAAEDDLLYVEDVVPVKQTAGAASVSFDDDAVADFFDAQIDAGRRPERFARIWIHTHPGESARPSGVDRETFERVFGGCDWAAMLIVSRGGETHCTLRFNTGPGAALTIPVAVDYARPFAGSDHAGWAAEYERHVTVKRSRLGALTGVDVGDLREVDDLGEADDPWDDENLAIHDRWHAALARLTPEEREVALRALHDDDLTNHYEHP